MHKHSNAAMLASSRRPRGELLMKRTRIPLAVVALWLAGSASGGEEAAPPRTGLRLETNSTEATWSVSWQGTPLVTEAKYGLAREEARPIEVDFKARSGLPARLRVLRRCREAELVDVDCLRLNVVFPDSRRRDWSVVLDRNAVIR
jgi:hypothetical protein